MTSILCNWLNDDVKLSKKVDSINFCRAFSSGYLIGEVLHKYQLQDDFDLFSQNTTSDAYLNNFTRLEPSLHLLGLHFDTNLARDIMTEKQSSATNLMYQLYIVLNNKKKANLTSVAMETMMAAAPARLHQIGNLMYKERLKQLTPRQADLNLMAVSERFHTKQIEMEKIAFKERFLSEEQIKMQIQKQREISLERARQMRMQQSEMIAKIRSCKVNIPTTPPNQTVKALEKHRQKKRQHEAQEALKDIGKFENKMKNTSGPLQIETSIFIQTNDEYISEIRKRLEEDKYARVEREKRRRKVVVDQQRAQDFLWSTHRDEVLVKRGLRQTQQERKIVVQLLQTRLQKNVILKNRIIREKQYEERREKDFLEAMNREAELLQLAKEQYKDQIQKDIELHEKIKAERKSERYHKHYEMSYGIVLQMVDFACQICAYRAISDRSLLTEKIMREWKALFISGQPFYEEPTEQVEVPEPDPEMEETKLQLLDEEDFKEYKDLLYEWTLPEDVIKPKDNPIIGHIVARLLTLMNPPTPPPDPPVFPKFPVRACVLGKVFSGKTLCISKLIKDYSIAVLNVDDLVKDSIEAYKNKEQETDISCEPSSIKLDSSLKDFDPAVNISEQAASQLQNPVSNLSTQDVPQEAVVDTNEQIPLESESNPVASHVNIQDTRSKSIIIQSQNFSPVVKLSNKALLGQKICESLKQGKTVDDQVLVEVVTDAIRNLPEESGWVLDGFPVTYNQTKTLEKALSGIDARKAGIEPILSEENIVPQIEPKEKKLKKSKLVPDPRPKPPSPEPDSGLDVVILLDIPDDLSLKRAAGQYESVETGDKYHILFNPAPMKDISRPSASQNIVPLKTETFDEENAQCRLMTHLDNWPDMERWFERFGKLHKIDADQDIDIVYNEMKRIFEETFEEKEAKEKAAEEEVVPEVINEITEPINAAEETVPEGVETMVDEGEKPKEETTNDKTAQRSREGSVDSSVSKKGKRSPQKAENKSPKGSKKIGSVSPKDGKAKRTKSNMPGQEPEPEMDIALVPSLPVIVPGSLEWVFVDTDVNMEMAIQLASYWEAIENTYVDNCKKMLREIRTERDSIKPYFYDIKFIFLEYLKRPDNKQEFVNQWQKEYNAIPDDIRFDEETQTEIHQTVDDLRERLWNICDEQKQQAETECQAIMNNGWYEDRLGKLCNNYLTLMQAEIDRFQNTIHLLKDYYKISDKQIPPQPELNYSRLPLIEIFNTKLDFMEGSPQKDAANIDGKKLNIKKKPATPDTFTEAESIASQGTKSSQEPKTPKEREKSSRERPASRSPSAKQAKKGKDKDKDKEEDKQYQLIDPETLAVRLKIPLITPAGTQFLSPEGAVRGDGKKFTKDGSVENQLSADMTEKGILEAYQLAFQQALNEVATLMNAEQTAKEIEEEEERLRELEKEKGRLTADRAKKGKKNKKGSASSKKGKKDEELTPSPAIEMSEEERAQRAMKEKIKQEYYFALEEEETAIKSRLQLIKTHSLEYVVKELQTSAENTYKPMSDWIGAKFLRQMESIDQMTEVMKNAIENGQKLKNEVLLLQEDFYIDKIYKVLMSPTPPPPPGFVEYHPEQMTCAQLSAFLKQFCFTAPSGIMDSKSFQETLEDLVCTTKGSDTLPNLWMSSSLSQIQQNIHTIAKTLSSDTDYIDWHQFLLCAIYPFVEFSAESLYRLFVSFFEVDVKKTGYINYDQYNSVELWTEEESIRQNTGYGFDRSKRLKKVFFDLFSEVDSHTAFLDYEKMLLYFCATSSVTNGFIRALSLASMAHMMKNEEPLGITNNRLPINIPEKPEREKSPLGVQTRKSSQESEGTPSYSTPSQTVESTDNSTEQRNYIKTALDQMIPIEALFKVLHHGEVTDGRFHRMNENCNPVDLASMERLVSAYIELGGKNACPLHYSVLIEHPLIQDLMNRNQFLLMDIKSILSHNADGDNSRKWK